MFTYFFALPGLESIPFHINTSVFEAIDNWTAVTFIKDKASDK